MVVRARAVRVGLHLAADGRARARARSVADMRPACRVPGRARGPLPAAPDDAWRQATRSGSRRARRGTRVPVLLRRRPPCPASTRWIFFRRLPPGRRARLPASCEVRSQGQHHRFHLARVRRRRLEGRGRQAHHVGQRRAWSAWSGAYSSGLLHVLRRVRLFVDFSTFLSFCSQSRAFCAAPAAAAAVVDVDPDLGRRRPWRP